jgi:alcohol dehydrogenase class IV
MRFEKARQLIHEFKQDRYIYGSAVLGEAGRLAGELGDKAALVHPGFPGSQALVDTVARSLAAAGVDLLGRVRGAAPNAPREDVFRISARLEELNPSVIISLGGGSTIDATKAAEVLRTLGGEIDDYFGTDRVTEKLKTSEKTLAPLLAVQTAASSAAHLTKYSNITDKSTWQKKLIVDEAVVPRRALFDYEVTTSMPPALTADGAWDGLSHSLEALYGAVGHPFYHKVAEVAKEGIGLVVEYVERAMDNPSDSEARSALGYATDLGGYAIMLGSTNAAHFTSFSLVDILSHGRACGIMNAYYTVFFAPAIQEPLRIVGKVFQDAGLTDADIYALSGRGLGEAVAKAMMVLSRRVGFPTTLAEVDGFSAEHVQRILTAAKDPQLRMKLENMPVPVTADTVDEYLGSVLEAARVGDLSLIRNVP